MRTAKSETITVLEGADIIFVTDLMLEWCQLNNGSLDELLAHRSTILARYQRGERCPDVLFEGLQKD
jgi:hypothetical protein